MQKISLAEFAERTGRTKDSVYVYASLYKKRHGKHPDWYLSDERPIMVDWDAYHRHIDEINDLYSRGQALYFELEERLRTQHRIACTLFGDKLASRWTSFFSHGLFMPRERPMNVPYRLIREFVKVGEAYLKGKKNND